jgi:protein subunit release factor A
MNMENLKISTIKPADYGGQRVGLAIYGIRVDHLDSGISAECKFERSQMKNRDVCLAMIEAGLAKLKQ